MMSEQEQAPVWARPEVFPEKPSPNPESGVFFVYGYRDAKGKEFAFEDSEQLVKAVEDSKQSIDLAWCPEKERLVAPEEVVSLRPSLWKRRCKWANDDFEDGKRMTLIFLLICSYYAFVGFSQTGDFLQVLRQPTLGVAAILMLIFGLVPLYEGWKTLKKGEPKTDKAWGAEVDESRFEIWLGMQKMPVTKCLLGVMIIVGLSQIYLEGMKLDWSSKSVWKAGLLKRPEGFIGGEWWRYVTAPFLHGNLLHWLMNAAGIRYLGRRVESLARWPHILIVIVLSAWVGGLFTAYFSSKPSVGASGGIMGWLGFLLVFEVLHARLVPKPARRRLIAGVVMTALMGILGFQFIDNAAHTGGLLAGMAYAAIIFPPSKSPNRPRIMEQDRWIAMAAGGVIVLGMLWTLMKLLA